MAPALAADFSSWLGNPERSDCVVRISVPRGSAEPSSSSKRRCAAAQRVREIPAHLIILQQAEYVKCRMNPCWSKEEPGVFELQLDDESEVEAAELLLRMLYSTADVGAPLRGAAAAADGDAPPPPQATLLRVMLLADRLQAALCATAAAHELAQRPALEWETVLAVYHLPPACADNPALAPLLAAAATGLVERLGDLDAAWLDPARAAELLALPFAAVAALVGDARTAASENTVFYTCDAWLAQHGGGEPEQQAALAAALRAPHLTPLYLAGVAGASDWLSRHISARELLGAAAFAAAHDVCRQRMLAKPAHPAARRAAWREPPRPESPAAKALHIAWNVPVSELQALHERAELEGVAHLPSPPSVWQGLRWDLRLHAARREGGVLVGVYVFAHLPPGCCEEAFVSASVKVEAAHLSRGFTVMPFSLGSPSACGLGTSEGRGFADAFGLGAGLRAGWDEAAWRAAGLVGERGSVSVRATIRDVA
ncbi:hypothetical protein Rsub_07238 [Raphidocelis subcapitata]|uniref:BACK domain-containing protein n=1 Tax=Raphidocelis subcapitata TaxID=307507 RepID=A0A2V0P3I5_9CHLO|nr:hypothetical protein Rsub_07238 [Raphidocelis subcapitata]|eukprot:GBF94424.1 hypothetical protein Rsub_07238 [Raphidocelis subcapitata]